MDRRTIGVVWIAGIILTVALYAIGPQNFIAACEAFIDHAWWWLGDVIEALTLRAFDAVRAVAIGLYVVFVVLAVLAQRRGIRTGGGLFVVSILFLVLIDTHWYESRLNWFSAAVLAGVGAAVMTRRLIAPMPPHRRPQDPWGTSRFSATNQPGTPPN